MSTRLEFNVTKVSKRFERPNKEARNWLKNEVAKDCTSYVPFEAGKLRESVDPSISVDDDQLIYNVPYARRQYYGDSFHFSTKGTGSRWFEKSKAINKPKWLRGVADIYGGRVL